ncbi:MAG: transporter permease [Paenibacillus sp.]|jgi:ABC-2 type transport system permease protein|nr:transporter permease [Paenibacillus sp.]
MFSVMLSQWMKEKRSPYMLLLFVALSIVAVLLFGMSKSGVIEVDVFADKGVSEAEIAPLMERLNENGTFAFRLLDEETARSKVREGLSSSAIRLMKEDFRIVMAVEDYNVGLLDRHVKSVLGEELALREAEAKSGEAAASIRESVMQYMEQPPLAVELTTPEGGKVQSYDMGLQLTYAFSLFIVMFTIGFKINAINSEKTSGIWNRMVLSPLSKSQMYLGHMAYSAIIGIVQVAVVLAIFRFGFGFAIGDRYGELLAVSLLYVISVVAMAMLFTGITRTPEKFNMLYPSIIPVIPLVSGAYMPPGTITSDILLGIAQIFPMSHAMEAFLGLSMYDAGWSELFMPVAKLLLVTVVFMGIGINLVERNKP